MKILAKGFIIFFVSNLAVVFVLIILPVFLITNNVAVLDQVIDYLFNTKK